MPQVIQSHNTPEQLETALDQALLLLEKYTLDETATARLLPRLVELLADKAVAVIPDIPPMPLHLPGNARH